MTKWLVSRTGLGTGTTGLRTVLSILSPVGAKMVRIRRKYKLISMRPTTHSILNVKIRLHIRHPSCILTENQANPNKKSVNFLNKPA